MKTVDFLRKHTPVCREGAKWALSISEDMADVWDALAEQGNCKQLLWTVSRPGVFPDSALRRLACRFVRETPLHDGRAVWDLLTDERSRKAVEVAEAYVDGNATEAGLYAARADARVAADAEGAADADYAAAYAAYAAAVYAADVASAAASAAASYAAYAAADDVADAYAASYAAESAQIKMIAQLGNPFKKEPSNENR